MKPTEDLFLLIKALTKAEKTNFRLIASAYGRTDKNYLLLFRAIDGQQKYDEQAIREFFKGETFLKKLDVTKIYLYNLILQSLRSFQPSAIPDIRLKNMLIDVEKLCNKSLFMQAQKILIKAEKLAEKHDKYAFLLEITSWKKRIIKAYPKAGTIEFSIHSIYKKEEDLIRKLENTLQYEYLEFRMHSLKRTEIHPRTQRAVAAYNTLMKHPALKNEKKALTYRSKMSFHWICSTYAQAKGDYRGMLNAAGKRLKLAESRLEQPSLNSDYIECISGYILACLTTHNFEAAEKCRLQLKEYLLKFPPKNPNSVQVLKGISEYYFSLLACIYSGDFSRGELIIPEAEKWITENEKKLNMRVIQYYYYNISYIYFGLSKYHKALKWVNRILNNPNNDIENDTHFFSMLMRLIIHYELGNTELLVSHLNSAWQLMEKKKVKTKFEKIFLSDFEQNILNVAAETNTTEGWKRLHGRLVKLFDNPGEKVALDFFDFISWAESKIQKKTFQEVVKGKSNIA